MTPPPPDPFPAVYMRELKRGTRLVRIHHRDYAATSFNPGLGRPTRFAPLHPTGAPLIPHAYAASDYESAAHETVFHEVQFDAMDKTVASTDIEDLMRSTVRCRRPLRLASLFEPDLNRWQIKRSLLIDTFASAYTDTVKWALAIHANSTVDGLIWTSKRCDPQTAVMLFGDRVLPGDLEKMDSKSIMSGALRRQLELFAERAGIAIIEP